MGSAALGGAADGGGAADDAADAPGEVVVADGANAEARAFSNGCDDDEDDAGCGAGLAFGDGCCGGPPIIAPPLPMTGGGG